MIYNDPPDSTTGFPDGTSPMNQIAAVGSNTLLIGTTTATGATVNGAGVERVVMVVDTTNPSAPSVVEKLAIPGMAVVTGISVQGSQAFVIGASQNWQLFLAGYGGDVVVATLDLTNPDSPTVMSTQDLGIPSTGIESIEALGAGRYVTTTMKTRTTRPQRRISWSSTTATRRTSGRSPSACPTSLTTTSSPATICTPPTAPTSWYMTSAPVLIRRRSFSLHIQHQQRRVFRTNGFNPIPTKITGGAGFNETVEWDLGPAASQTITVPLEVTAHPGRIAPGGAGGHGIVQLPGNPRHNHSFPAIRDRRSDHRPQPRNPDRRTRCPGIVRCRPCQPDLKSGHLHALRPGGCRQIGSAWPRR